MDKIEYIRFDEIDLDNLIQVLNEERVRDHLVSHPVFDSNNINEWVNSKLECDSLSGCRTRAIAVNNKLIGWCGIQHDIDEYELAIVLSESYWGLGPSIFKDLVSWARELEHHEVVIHLLETRREYKFLKQASSKVKKTKMLNREFTTYHIPV